MTGKFYHGTENFAKTVTRSQEHKIMAQDVEEMSVNITRFTQLMVDV